MAPKNKLFQRMEYDDGCLINEAGDVSIVFALHKKPYSTRSCDEFAMDHHGLVKALQVLPAGVVLHFLDRYFKREYVALSPGTHELQHCYKRHFDHRPYLVHEGYLSVTITGGKLVSPRQVFRALKKQRLTPKAASDLATLRKFQETVERFILIFQQETGTGCRLLTRGELMGTRKTMGLSEPSSVTFPAGSDVMVLEMDSQDGLKVGNQYVSVISLSDADSLPGQISSVVRDEGYSTDRTDFPIETAACMGHQLDFDHVRNLYIRIGNGDQEIKGLDKKIKRLESLGGKDSANQAVQTDTRAYRDQLAAGGRLPVFTHANVIVWAPERETLAALQQQVVAQMVRSWCWKWARMEEGATCSLSSNLRKF